MHFFSNVTNKECPTQFIFVIGSLLYSLVQCDFKKEKCKLVCSFFFNFSFLGYAHVRTVCTKKSASINEDLGGFGGIITATHELAHRY